MEDTTLISVLHIVLTLCMTAIAGSTLAWMLYAWRSPDGLDDTTFPAERTPTLSFSLIVPARHEEAVLGHTLARLAQLDHPDFEIIAVVGDDDPATAAVADAAAARFPGLVRVVVDDSVPKSKPKALNRALPSCRKSVVGVFDAEDDVHPQLLRRIDGLLAESGAQIAQGGVQLVNWWSNWFSTRNCLEYYFWFRSRLHFHADMRFIPLGGNTVFVRTDVLRNAGGWDDECLAEDCELGVRLSAAGARTAVAYDPEVATREETPPTFGALLKQRTRWNQGFLQVLRAGHWRRIQGRSRRMLARYTLAMPFLQALTGVMIPVSIATALLLKLPLAVALASFLPLALTLITLFVELIGLSDLRRMFPGPARWRDHVRLVVGLPAYQLMLAAAAVRAVWRENRGRRNWEKTAHAGVHLEPAEAR